MSKMAVGKRVLAGAFGLSAVGTQLALRLGPFNRTIKPLLDALAWLHIARVGLARQRPVRALLMALALVRVAPKAGHEDAKISLLQWLLRRLLFGRAVALPPVVPPDLMVRGGRKYGRWNLHLLAEDHMRSLGKAFTILRPFSSTSWQLVTPIVFVSDPEMVKTVMTDKATYPSRGHTGFSTLVGNGLLGLPTSDKWSFHRRLVSKFLSERHLRGYAKIVEGQVDVFLAKWRKASAEGRQVNGYYDMSMLTLDIIMEIGTGERTEHTSMQSVPEEENELAHELDWALQDIVVRTASPLYDMLPNARIEAFRAKLDALFSTLLERAKSIPEDERPESSILHGLLSAKNEDGTPALTEEEVNDEFKTIRGAGHETTGNTVCFMIKLLQENPDKLAVLREELDREVAGECPTFEEARKLKYAHQVMFETLRLYPTVPNFPREAACDTKLGKYDVPKGSFVFVSQQAMNRDPTIWPEPHAFRPERFAELPDLQPTKPVGVPGRGELEYAFLPFGAGARTCIGQRLSLLEGVQIVAAIAKNFDFRLAVPSEDLYVQTDVTLGPKHGMPLIIKERTMES